MVGNFLQLLLVVLGVSSPAHATEPPNPPVMLACKGTEAMQIPIDERPGDTKISLGLILDFQKQIVIGFERTGRVDFPVKLGYQDETRIRFAGGGKTIHEGGYMILRGEFDRITGNLSAVWDLSEEKVFKSQESYVYDLQCRPQQQRLF